MEEREQDGLETVSKEIPPENLMPKSVQAPANGAVEHAERDDPLPQYDSFMRVIRR